MQKKRQTEWQTKRQTKRPWLSLVIAVGAAAVAPMASAVGFASAPSGALLGQPLDFAVQVRLDPGEAMSADCVSADVSIGDRRLPAAQVRVAVNSSGDGARIQVATTLAVDEPLATVQITSTCATARLSRRFTLFADPPQLAAGPAPVVAAPAYAVAPPLASTLLPGETPRTGGATANDGAGGTAVLRALPPAGAGVAVATAPVQGRHGMQMPAAPSPAADRTTSNRAAGTRAERRAQAASRVVARNEQAPRRPQRAAAAQAAPRPATPSQPQQLAQAAPAAPAPRLKLDAAEPVINADAMIIDQALEAVAEAASAARAQASAASATAARIAALERTVDAMRAEAQGSRDLAVQLRERIARSDDGGRWMWPLFIAAVLLAALASWLAWRLAAVQRQRQADWLAATGETDDPAAPVASRQRGGTAAGTGAPGRQHGSEIPVVTSEFGASAFVTAAAGRPGAVAGQPRPVQLRTGTAPAWPPAVSPPPPDSALPDADARADAHDAGAASLEPPSTVAASLQMHGPATVARQASAAAQSDANARAASRSAAEAMQRTQPLPPSMQVPERTERAVAATPRDVSIEELIDLEQQAEFFVVLGQDDAAIDLLVEHLRNTGGGSPLPYLKLLEIYGRRGDRADYERMRTRFNHRFNAYAPEWGVDLQAGDPLEHYASVIGRLQQVWTRPLDAMAELEALLFRKSRGDLFDLPAYREVLFLYSLARDLLDREASDSGNVDLLLPLADGGEFSSTAPAPFLGMELAPRPAAEMGLSLQLPTLDHTVFDERPTAPVDLDLSVDVERTQSIFDMHDTQQLPPPPAGRKR